MTLLEKVRAGKIPVEVRHVAADERVDPEVLARNIALGHAVVPANRCRKAKRFLGIGKGLRTKVNANIGTSRDYPRVAKELAKLDAAVKAGADAVMDLSTGGDIRAIRRAVVKHSPIAVGSVSIYDAAVAAVAGVGKNILAMTPDSMLAAFRAHAEDGIDFITVHAGVTRDVLADLAAHPRVCGMVSRGGTFLAEWMKHHKAENPYYERFDELLDIAREFDVTLSLGDGLRPGAIADANDPAQLHELRTLAGLARRALAKGVQSMIEGPGHVPLHLVAEHVRYQKKVCHGAPFYVLGPLVTDIAPGYDHITSAIGGAVAAAAGADFLCYVTPSEHLSLPSVEEVHTGVIAARIAAHAGDIAKGLPHAADWDRTFSQRRRKRDWKKLLSDCIDPAAAKRIRLKGKPADSDVCSMCGEYCVFRLQDELD
jgi:phosphomethylpyrimidine synthase